MRLSLILAVVLCPAAIIGQKSIDLAEQLLECSKDDSKTFDACLRDIMEELRKQMPEGFPELGLGPSDPMEIKNLKFLTKPGFGDAVTVNADFSNVEVRGLSNFITEDIHADLEARTLKIKMSVPVINIKGTYNATGRVLVLELDGAGDFNAVLKDATGEGFGRIVERKRKNGETALSVKDTNIDFEIPGVEVKLFNLFGGQYPALANQANNFINDHSQAIINGVKPQIKHEVTKLFQKVMAKAFSRLPVKEFLDRLPANRRDNRSLKGPFPQPASFPRRQTGFRPRPQQRRRGAAPESAGIVPFLSFTGF